MSRAAAAAGGAAWRDESWGARLADRVGHHANEVLIVAIAATIALGVRPLPGLFGLTVPVALFGVVIAAWLLMRQHDRKLCEACMSAMPLNAAERATKLKRRFWVAHTGSEPRFLIPYLAVLIGSNFAIDTIGRPCWGLIQSTMIYLVLAQSTHRRLQPWCPWCSGGGGGEKVDEAPPVLPHDDRQLV